MLWYDTGQAVALICRRVKVKCLAHSCKKHETYKGTINTV